jgi:hypothetical protein
MLVVIQFDIGENMIIENYTTLKSEFYKWLQSMKTLTQFYHKS